MSELAPELSTKLGILDLIERTQKYAAFTEAWKGMFKGQFEKKGTKYFKEAIVFDNAHAQSMVEINDALKEVGGLPATIDLEDNTKIDVRLGAWLGLDPSNPSQHKWLPAPGSPGAEYSLAPGALEEIRGKLLEAFDV